MTNYERGKQLLYGGYTAYTPDLKSRAVKAKRYGREPRVGAIIEYYVASKGRIGHTGIVVDAEFRNGAYDFHTVEGNSGNEVRIIHHNLTPAQIGNGNPVDGFVYPDYCAETCSAEQLVAIARSQVGYREKNSNRDLESFRTDHDGGGNYTKFGAWAAACGWGYNPAEWCAMFVSWCAYMACVSAHDYDPGWFKDGNDWLFRKKGGEYARDEWVYDGGRWYVFDNSGHMIRGWFKDSTGDWYYMAGDGAMCSSQWVADDKGRMYYLTASGAMARTAYVKEPRPDKAGQHFYYFVDEHGVYQKQYDTYFPHLEIYEEAV